MTIITSSNARRWLVPVVACIIIATAAGCDVYPSIASAAGTAPAPLPHHGAGEFRSAAVVIAAGRTTGEVGLSSVLPGQRATFRVAVAARMACEGHVAYSGQSAAEWTVFDSISTGSAGELSWTWDTPMDASPAGGHVAMTCGGDAFRIPFVLGAPEIGTLALR